MKNIRRVCRIRTSVFVFKLVNGSLASNVISTSPKSIFRGRLVQIWRCIGRWTPASRNLITWPALVATLKDLAPYAAIELLLPGGSLMALTLWLYRRRNRAPVLARFLNSLL
jgi:hypothetical protein